MKLHNSIRILFQAAAVILLTASVAAATPVHKVIVTDTSSVSAAELFLYGPDDGGGHHGDDDDHTPTTTLRKIADLNFGGIFSGATSGTVVVYTNGNVTSTGGVIRHIGVQGYTAHPAEVCVNIYNDTHCRDDDHCSNDDNECDRDEDDDGHHDDDRNTFERHGADVNLTVGSITKLKRVGGTETMTADNFHISRNNGYVMIGATLHVNANQKSGNYYGTFHVTTICE